MKTPKDLLILFYSILEEWTNQALQLHNLLIETAIRTIPIFKSQRCNICCRRNVCVKKTFNSDLVLLQLSWLTYHILQTLIKSLFGTDPCKSTPLSFEYDFNENENDNVNITIPSNIQNHTANSISVQIKAVMLTSLPSWVLFSSATRPASEIAATRRGCVMAMTPCRPMPASYRYWGI